MHARQLLIGSAIIGMAATIALFFLYVRPLIFANDSYQCHVQACVCPCITIVVTQLPSHYALGGVLLLISNVFYGSCRMKS